MKRRTPASAIEIGEAGGEKDGKSAVRTPVEREKKTKMKTARLLGGSALV